ncbi:hypothetical protein [Bacillus cereus group sp. BfR-BA-01495]|uniref:hypothetical protein n=1 Tax=Bacillus cereus group sp. BfR-BA-01495 TaxID=2920363 RepID=UPI001F574C3E|nr:hypothetical protein [Bacillus cereus group sp. BfR-BA-01495]
MREREEIERKLEDKEYLERIRHSDHEMEVISRIVKKHKGNIDELLKTEDALDLRTIKSWIKKEKIPKKSNMEKFRETEDYQIVLKEIVKEKVEEYERRTYYYQKIELDEPLKQSILGKEFESEITSSKLFMDDEGNFYVLKKLPTGIATDEIEAELIDKKIYENVEVVKEVHKKLIKRVENLNFSNLNDLQYSSSVVAFLDFYEKYPNADFLFNHFFSKQYDLFSQLLDKRIEPNEFSTELKKLIDIVYAKIEIENDK